MQITFERATPDDAAALAEASKLAFEHDIHYGAPAVGGPPGYDSAGWQAAMMQQATAYYKILADGQIAGGIIVFDLGNERYELGRLFVAPAFQDRGIGTRAMGFIERAHPAARCWQLGTPTWAVRNQHFYEKCGYVKVGKERDAAGTVVGVRYEKRLVGPPQV
jgi:GNAT superfamily N-acetyltransferase